MQRGLHNLDSRSVQIFSNAKHRAVKKTDLKIYFQNINDRRTVRYSDIVRHLTRRSRNDLAIYILKETKRVQLKSVLYAGKDLDKILNFLWWAITFVIF